MAEKKDFVGNCKKIQNWGVKVGFRKTELEKLIHDSQKSEWVNIVVVPQFDKDDKKPYAYLDQFQPQQQKEETQLKESSNVGVAADETGDLPF
jgi:ABC-type metal ion transport system substrate-binding protein